MQMEADSFQLPQRMDNLVSYPLKGGKHGPSEHPETAQHRPWCGLVCFVRQPYQDLLRNKEFHFQTPYNFHTHWGKFLPENPNKLATFQL